MNKKISIALKKSIEHWHRNLDMLILNHLSSFPLGLDLEIFKDTCPLCILFFDAHKRVVNLVKVAGSYKAVEKRIKDYRRLCWGCPIYKRTLKNKCRDTPWNSVYMFLNRSARYPYKFNGKEYKIIYMAVAAELEFLYTLLEE